MMLLLMQIDAEHNTEYRAACRNDTADQRNDSHRASPLPLSWGTTEVPPGFREQTAFSPGSLSDQNSLVPVYQSSTISASRKPPQGFILRRLLFSLYVRKLGGLSKRHPNRSFFWRRGRRWGRCRPGAPGRRGRSGRSCRPLPSSSARSPARRTTWS